MPTPSLDDIVTTPPCTVTERFAALPFRFEALDTTNDLYRNSEWSTKFAWCRMSPHRQDKFIEWLRIALTTAQQLQSARDVNKIREDIVKITEEQKEIKYHQERQVVRDTADFDSMVEDLLEAMEGEIEDDN